MGHEVRLSTASPQSTAPKCRAPAGLKNIAGDERLARGIAYIETEIDYYLDRLDIIDETVSKASRTMIVGQMALVRSCDRWTRVGRGRIS